MFVHIFLRLSSTLFKPFGTSFVFSRAWSRIRVFLASFAKDMTKTMHVFPALGSDCKFVPRLAAGARFYRAWQRVHVFPALGSGCTFYRAWQRVHVFPALGSDCKFVPRLAAGACFSRAWQPLQIRSVLGSGCMFSRP